jgi:hypothetical protein
MIPRRQYKPDRASAVQFCQLWSDHVDALDRHLSSKMWTLAAITLVLISYPIARIVIPAVLHAAVPDLVRTVLNFT